MHRTLLAAVLSLSIVLSTFVAAQAAEYTFITFDPPDATHTLAFGINAVGQVVGRYGSATLGNPGFLKDGMTFTTIVVPGATFFTEPRGINTAGQIVGVFSGDTAHGDGGRRVSGRDWTPTPVAPSANRMSRRSCCRAARPAAKLLKCISMAPIT
jgi:hypothetical protein